MSTVGLERTPLPPNAGRGRLRWAPFLLLAAAGALALTVLPKLPRDQRVGIRLPDASTVTVVEVTWFPLKDRPDIAESKPPSVTNDALKGGSWNFAAGSAPSVVETQVRLPDGRYELDVTIERGGTREVFHKTLALGEADHITVPLR